MSKDAGTRWGGGGGHYNSPSNLSEGHCDTEHLTSTNVQRLQVDL